LQNVDQNHPKLLERATSLAGLAHAKRKPFENFLDATLLRSHFLPGYSILEGYHFNPTILGI
jgi:hypothetical protein